MIPEFADEIFVGIFSYLAPSDLVCSCRLVCRRFSRISKEFTVWLEVFANCDYVLPILEDGITTNKLEQILLRAEYVKDVWTGRRPGIPRTVRKYNTDAYFLAVMDEYFVVLENAWLPELRWYSLEDSSQPVFTYKAGMDSPSRRIHSWSASVKGEINAMYILYTQTDPLADGVESNYLKLSSIKLSGSQGFQTRVELSYKFDDKSLFESIRILRDSVFFDGSVDPEVDATVGLHHIAVYPRRKSSDTLIHLFDIFTGKMFHCRWHQKCPYHDDWPLIRPYFQAEITPRHFVQILYGDLEFYSLPTAEELLQADAPLLATRTHTVVLPSQFIHIDILSQSPTTYMALAYVLFEQTLELYDIDITHPGGGEVTFDVEYTLCAGTNPTDFNMPISPGFPSASAFSRSHLAARLNFSNRAALYPEQPGILALWACSHLTPGEDGPGAISLPQLALPGDPSYYMTLHDPRVVCVDPFLGRVTLSLFEDPSHPSDPTLDPDNPVILVIDYVPPVPLTPESPLVTDARHSGSNTEDSG